MKLNIKDIVHLQETTLTIRGSRRRTTIPREVLDFFGLKDKDSIRWVLLKDGTVRVMPAGKKIQKTT